MAIHIKELNITLHIGDGTDNEKADKKRPFRKKDSCCSPENQRAVLEQTVREVIRVLNEQKER
jgi:hypothetical protein